MRLRNWLAGLLAAVLLIGSIPMEVLAAASTEFSDFPDDWSAPALETAVENELLLGVDGQINPGGMLTRAQLAAVLTRALGVSVQDSMESYSDVPERAWYYDAVSRAVYAEILTGSENKIYPEQTATRQEVFVVLSRVLKLEDNVSGINSFSDKGEIADWARGPVGALAAAGYIQGSNGNIKPNDTITRAEFAQVLINISSTYWNTPKEYSESVEGNIIISTSNVSLKDMTVEGDLILGAGDVRLTNVVVKGRLVIRGEGTCSINIINSQIHGNVVLANPSGTTRIVIADSSVGTMNVYSSLILEGDVDKLVLKNKVSLDVQNGTVSNLIIEDNAKESSVKMPEGTTVTEPKSSSGSSGSSDSDGNYNGFSGGKGTVSNPWQISTAAQLNRVRDYLDRHFILTADIDLSNYANWAPIGSYVPADAAGGNFSANLKYAFTGSFTGGGYTVSNLKIARDGIDAEDMTGTGLFGGIGGSASIQNLKISNVAITSTGSCTGALVGMAMSSNKNAIKNITLTGTNTVTGYGSVAGLVGSSQDTNIIDCSAVADVVMSGASNGAGILGGGIEGGIISGCKASGTVTAISTMSYGGTVIGAIGVGGLAGCAFDSEEVIDCTVDNVIIRVGENAVMVGGLLGYSGIVNEGLFTNDSEGFTLIKGCIVANTVIEAAEGTNRIGGIVGSGFCGSNYNSYYPASSAIHIVDCTASCTITGADADAVVGSVIGYAFRNSAVVSCSGSVTGAVNQVGAADAAQAVALENVDSMQAAISVTDMLKHASFEAAASNSSYEPAFMSIYNAVNPSFDGGDGSESSPWKVSTAEQLNQVRNYPDDNFILINNIDLSGYGGWEPIGSYIPKDAAKGDFSADTDYAFTGSFDGGGYTISNLTVTRSAISAEDMTGTGLFGGIGGDASIQNLKIVNADIFSTGSCTGALVGMSMSSHHEAIKNIVLSGTNTIIGYGSVAGLIGSSQDTNIIGCSVTADVIMSGASNGAGILGGGIEGGIISGCEASGTVTATSTMSYGGVAIGAIGVGGLAGCAFDSKEVIDCIVDNVTIRVGENSIMVGGLLGYSGIVNEGDFTSDPEGFTLIKNCIVTNSAIEAAEGTNRIGGIVGSGFCGSNYSEYYPASSAIHIVNCEVSSEITGADKDAVIGSIIGYAFRNCAVVSCRGSVTGAVNQVGAADAAQVVGINKVR